MRKRLFVASAALLPAIAIGCGGKSSSSRDHGTPSQIYPAPHTALPLLVKGTGGSLVSPHITAITFPGDPLAPFLEDFVGSIGATPWWNATADYDVGPATATTAVHWASAAPATITDAAIQSWLVAELTSTTAGWPAASANSLYVVFYPEQTTVTTGVGASCTNFGGYHGSVNVNTQAVAYAVVPRCDGGGLLSTLDLTTVDASHEIAEAVTDPIPPATATSYSSISGWSFRDVDAAWTLGGPEVADICGYWSDADINVGIPYLVERYYSNTAAAASHDPCRPSGLTYFNAAPVLPDTFDLAVGPYHFTGVRGLKVPVGSSKTIEVDLFSDKPTNGPFLVDVFAVKTDLTTEFGLDVSVDRPYGENGEKIYLTVDAVGTVSPGSLVVLESSAGGIHYLWPISVVN